jgi:hypothetical protein
MKYFLSILVLSLLWCSNSFAERFYFKGIKPIDLVSDGYVLHSVQYSAALSTPTNNVGLGLYTFIKDDILIFSCEIYFENTRVGKPYINHKCFKITHSSNH